MAGCTVEIGKGVEEILSQVGQKLKEHGIDLDCCCATDDGKPGVKVICVAPDLTSSVQEMGASPRDQTLMVRVDEQTNRTLDAWVETGYVKSRSEAAALFIREGLKVRASELEQLKEALDSVERARKKLRDKAREVFGQEPA